MADATVPGAVEPAASVGGLDAGARLLSTLARALGPILAALVVGGAIVAALGHSPVDFYSDVWQQGVRRGWEDSVNRATPLLFIAAGLIVVFRAGIWNLGVDGQYILAGAFVAGYGGSIFDALPRNAAYVALFVLAAVVGAAWTLIPAYLKARYDTNEIITTLMMSFIAVSVLGLLVRGPFKDSSVNLPQTKVIPFEKLLPAIGDSFVYWGIVPALAALAVVGLVMARTALGLRLRVLGANRRAAVHHGLSVGRLTMVAFIVSGALVGMGAAAEVLGTGAGYVRADWNPGYGLAVVPLVFLARLNALATLFFVAFFAVLQIGGEYATRQIELPTDFVLVLVGLILLFAAVAELLGRRGQGRAPMLRTRGGRRG